MENKCNICSWYGQGELCNKHKKLYMLDISINAYRLKKRNTGSRYTQEEYHKSETNLVKILENYYGSNDIVTSVHPLWAITKKGVLYEYDIMIKSKRTLVEYNGIQHYKYVEFFHGSKGNYRQQKIRDRVKYLMACKNGYSIIIIKHDEPLFEDYIINKIENSN